MADIVQIDGSGGGSPDRSEEDPFRYGVRYREEVGPDGAINFIEIPLTEEDLLFPEEEDRPVQTYDHFKDVSYIGLTLMGLFEEREDVVVLGDHRIDWGVDGIRPMGPDIVVLFDVEQRLRRATFRVSLEGGRPVCVIEVTSKNTRDHDLVRKFDLYHDAGVERYILIDRSRDGAHVPTLLAYARKDSGWQPLALDDDGRVAIAPGQALLGLEGNRAWIYDAKTRERMLEGPELKKKMDAKVRALKRKARRDAKEREQAEAKVVEALGRLSAAEGLVATETKSRRDAETKARDADSKAAREAQARADAEVQVRLQTDLSAALKLELDALRKRLEDAGLSGG